MRSGTIASRCLAVVVLAMLAASGACGPSVRVEPLIGEEPELLAHVATTVPNLEDDPPTNAVRALRAAIVRKDMPAAWDLLSAETHAALDEAARAVGAPSGRTLFLAAPGDGIPILREGAPPLKVSPLQWLLTEDVAWYTRTLDGEPSDADEAEDGEDRTRVYVIDTDNRYREVRLRREGGDWRVHQPSVRYADLALYL